MVKSTRQEKFLELREEFPHFIFENYTYTLTERGLDVRFHFNLADRYHFYPALRLPRKSWFISDERIIAGLPVFLFNIGLVEMISYWKAACSPRIIIKPHALTGEQVAWWKKLWFHGLGEFFYLNGIEACQETLFEMEADSGKFLQPFRSQAQGSCLIPVGGGKDSSVTLEILGMDKGNLPFILNPRGATLESVNAAGIPREQLVEGFRTIDPTLLELNALGFLNGHTPFSAMLAFTALLAAHLSDKSYLVLSNESSANEATIEGTTINHQYSKSYEFETDFINYLNKFVAPGMHYFSFLRPLSELQIAKLFAGFTRYHRVFKSCNAGSKTDSWCGACAKCLFTWIILSPFIKEDQLVAIFGKNLFEDMSLIPLFDQLTGMDEEKPFECVGTIDEVNLALQQRLRCNDNQPLPALVEHYAGQLEGDGISEAAFDQALINFDPENHLPPEFETMLRVRLHD